MGISLCMITRNEEDYLQNCLDSVKNLVSETVIVDLGSTDNTLKIAKQYTDKIIEHKWNDDFSKARNKGINKASQDWILVLDPDEMIDVDSGSEIKKLVKNKADGYSIERRTYLMEPERGCCKNSSQESILQQYPFFTRRQIVRLFRNGKNICFKHRVHELVEDSMREMKMDIVKSDIKVHHLNFITEEKTELYSRLVLKQLSDDPESDRYNYYAANHYISVGELGKAIQHFKKTANVNPKYKLVYSDIARVYLQQKDLDNAVKYFRMSLENNPQNPSPANNLAVILMHKKEFSEAKEILETQMEKNPKNNALQINYQQLLKEMEHNRRNIAG